MVSGKGKIIFITATDTNAGKTVAMLVLGVLFKARCCDVGVMKPVQCAGHDAQFLKKALAIDDDSSLVNPFFAPEPLSPHLALRRAKMKFDPRKVKEALEALQKRHDIVLIEGAGGLLVPIAPGYTNGDLIRDLNAEVVIVSRLGLGAINHTLLTVQAAQAEGLDVRGIIFSDTNPKHKSLPERTNPAEIAKLTDEPVLGTIPYLKRFDEASVLNQTKGVINLKPLLTAGRLPLAARRRFSIWDKTYLWHPFTQMKDWAREAPLIIDSADGVYVKDMDGNRYIDGVSSLWVNVHGHRHRRIDAALKKQIDKLSHSTLLGLSHGPAIELSKRLVAIAPKGLKKVFYSDNGSTAVEIAVKMAYQYWQNIGQKKKTRLLHLANSYHGDTLGAVSIGGIDLFHKVYQGLMFKTVALKGHGWQAVEDLEGVLKTKGDHTAALVVEPLVQGAAGILTWPKGVLKRMRQLTKEYNVFLIADEVATGFGRTGTMFACQQEGVAPDFLCLAKGMTGGYLPLAATLTTKKVYDGFVFDTREQKTFFHGHTYTGNPLACAAALANLEIFDKEHTLTRLGPKIKFLTKQLKMFYNLASVVDVRQCGFMVGIELKGRWEDLWGARVCRAVREYGVLLRPLGNVIVIMPPLSISIEELDYLLMATYRIIEKMATR